MATSNASNTTITLSAAGAINWPKQPCFSARYPSSVTNQTGDGTVVTLIPSGVLFDQASNYNNGTGVFTAPVTGIYSFQWEACFGSLSAAFTSVILKAVATSRTFTLCKYNPGAFTPGVSSEALSGRFYINMTAGDTIYVTLQVSGGAKTVSIVGASASDTRTSFSGKLEV